MAMTRLALPLSMVMTTYALDALVAHWQAETRHWRGYWQITLNMIIYLRCLS